MDQRSIVISTGFTTDDIKTLDDCDRAFLELNDAIITIERQLADPTYIADKPPEWKSHAKAALRFKRVGLQVVQNKRTTLRREAAKCWASRFVDIVRVTHPDVFHAVQKQL